MKKRIRMNLFLITIFLLPFFSYASTVNADDEAAITVQLENLHHSNSDLQGLEIELYQVGDVSVYGEPKILEQYRIKNYPKTAEQTEAAALYIASHIEKQPEKVAFTSAEGTAVFTELKQGVYLLVAKNPNDYGVVTPILLHLPFYEEIDGVKEGPLFNITIKPKASLNTTDYQEQQVPEKNLNIDTEQDIHTGDNNDITLYFMLGGIAIAAFLCIFISKRKGGAK